MWYQKCMTTKEIVKFVDAFGDNTDAVHDALLEKLIAKEVTMKQLEKAIGEGSKAYPHGYPAKNWDDVIVCPTFLTVLSVALDRANGNPYAFAL